jgi:hypothetical protein
MFDYQAQLSRFVGHTRQRLLCVLGKYQNTHNKTVYPFNPSQP